MAAVAVWLGAVGFGMTVLWRYSATPGDAATPPVNWPRSLPVQPQKGRAMLVMFAHPQCPCSKASVEELAIIMARTQDSQAGSHTSSHTRKLGRSRFFLRARARRTVHGSRQLSGGTPNQYPGSRHFATPAGPSPGASARLPLARRFFTHPRDSSCSTEGSPLRADIPATAGGGKRSSGWFRRAVPP